MQAYSIFTVLVVFFSRFKDVKREVEMVKLAKFVLVSDQSIVYIAGTLRTVKNKKFNVQFPLFLWTFP